MCNNYKTAVVGPEISNYYQNFPIVTTNSKTNIPKRYGVCG